MPHLTAPPPPKSGDKSQFFEGEQPTPLTESGVIDANTLWIIRSPLTGQAFSGTYGDWIESGIMDANMTWADALVGQKSWIEALGLLQQANLDAENATGGGRGGGAAAPIYVRPDERLVENAVQGVYVSLVGKADEALQSSLVKQYMKDHRANFDNKGQQIDPMAGVQATIEATTNYKAIHDLRPEFIDPTQWVGSQIGSLLNAGVSPQLAVDLGIAQASVGSTPRTNQTAGEIAAFSTTGRLLASQKAKMQTSLAGVMKAL